MTFSRSLAILLIALTATVLTSCGKSAPTTAPKSSLTLFAAASLTDALTEAAKLYESRSSMRIIPNFAASSTLAQQIKSGAAADIFISADEEWMDDLASAGHILPGSRTDLLGNALVLIAPQDKPFTARMSADFDFAATLPGIKRIAIADPAHVPAGRYAKQSLEKLGWWPELQPMLLPAQDVRAALRLVELGEADAGIVYATDASSSTQVALVATFPPDSHDPIVYPAACIKRDAAANPPNPSNPAAATFLEFLSTPEAAAVFTRHGFRVLSRQ